jgi:hypothetical protein
LVQTAEGLPIAHEVHPGNTELAPKKWTLRNEFFYLFWSFSWTNEYGGNTQRRPRQTRWGRF